MTDKEFDALLEKALTSDNVPPHVNSELLKKIKAKKKKGKIYLFTKLGSAVAAMFVCGVAILSYFNDNPDIRTKAPATNTVAVTPSAEKEKGSLSPESAYKEAEKEDTSQEEKSAPEKIYTSESTAKENAVAKPHTAKNTSPVQKSSEISTEEEFPADESVDIIENTPAESSQEYILAMDMEYSMDMSNYYSGRTITIDSPRSLPEEELNEAEKNYTLENESHKEDTLTVITEETALQLAKEACVVSYDTTDVTYDSETALWCVHFYLQNTAGGNQNVFIDNSGVIQKITFGE